MYVPYVVNVTKQLSLPVAATNPSQKAKKPRRHDSATAPTAPRSTKTLDRIPATAEATLGILSDARLELSQEALKAIAREVAKILAAESTPARSGWLTVPQAAEHLGWPTQRVYKLTAAGAIPHRKHGQRLLFDRNELDAWLETYAHGPTPRGFQRLSKSA
jgi:excisionase family DNA binding protein